MPSSRLPHAVFAHSGGVTSVLNTTAASMIAHHRSLRPQATIYAAANGIMGLLQQKLYDPSHLDDQQLAWLSQTPASVFGSCRYKLPNYQDDPKPFQKLFAFFKAKRIGTFIYQGGNDSQDTLHKIAVAAKHECVDLQCIGLPKTIDNDLYGSDFSPGFPSCAKYLATSLYEASLDLAAMATGKGSTQVFVMEVMGRNTGWLAAATAIAFDRFPNAPHIILPPEHPYQDSACLAAVERSVHRHGYASIVVSEGLRIDDVAARSASVDAFNHPQLGGSGRALAHRIHAALGLKTHDANPDYLQRSAGHLRAKTDVDMAKKLGKWAIEAIDKRTTGIMLGFKRHDNAWTCMHTPLHEVALKEKKLPPHFYNPDTLHVTDQALSYFAPLLAHDPVTPTYRNGLPNYLSPKHLVEKKPHLAI